ncbi:uncharacterized protein BJ171DRAFT_10104 [Polychytrium aggregatum]|uniref:uncharacterized protein n=1 Tax=Polychytrium aggregatum TaxID=110093 RepID=UPI0022FE6761|nr:uncharacterized protein BJ171DRAFT_10104 [Polychytrium aggregatum]KAI9209878.1 hypothetical protein BJ171DRAFT_10104 [Polychytrium aggregatum]
MDHPKGILKRNASSRPTTSHSKLTWDEDNIMLTEAQRGNTMKITEPKTPFIHYDHERDLILGNTGDIPPIELTNAIQMAKESGGYSSRSSITSSSSSSSERRMSRGEWDSSSEDEEHLHMTAEERERHQRFVRLRAQHYNMKAALTHHQDEDDEEDDGNQGARSDSQKSEKYNDGKDAQEDDSDEDDADEADDGNEDAGETNPSRSGPAGKGIVRQNPPIQLHQPNAVKFPLKSALKSSSHSLHSETKHAEIRMSTGSLGDDKMDLS